MRGGLSQFLGASCEKGFAFCAIAVILHATTTGAASLHEKKEARRKIRKADEIFIKILVLNGEILAQKRVFILFLFFFSKALCS